MSTSTVPAVNVLIWLSVKPILKLAAPAAGGFFLTRAGLYPVSGSRAASQIVLNIALPALLFAKIVPSLNQSNVSAIGPICLIAFIYILMSLLMGSLVRTFTRTPHNFRYGILAASGWSNWGDLPTSVAQTVCAGAPFAAGDEDLAVAYVAIFILVFYITLFPLNGIGLIKADYTHPYVPPTELEEGISSARGKWWRDPAQLLPARRRAHKAALSNTSNTLGHLPTKGSGSDIELPELGSGEIREERDEFTPLGRANSTASARELAGAALSGPVEDTNAHNRRVSFKRLRMEQKERERLQTIVGSRAGSRAPSVFGGDEIAVADEDDDEEAAQTVVGSHAGEGAKNKEEKERERIAEQEGSRPGSVEMKVEREWNLRRVGRTVWGFVGTLISPPTISLLASLLIALVDKLKALFTVVEGGTFHPTAPDGNPPLAIILDTATFIGNASVPLSLTVLGSALARMRLPRPLSKLPVASIVSLALVKLVALPIMGFLIVQGLAKHTSLISEDNHTLIFVMTYFSVVPTATSQVSLSQIFAPEDGESNCDILSAYLIFQYFVFSISSVVLTSVTLSSIF